MCVTHTRLARGSDLQYLKIIDRAAVLFVRAWFYTMSCIVNLVIKLDILSCVHHHGLARPPASASALPLRFGRRPRRRNGAKHSTGLRGGVRY